MKIVINSCYGGFGLSNKAIAALALEGIDHRDIDRTDPRLIEIVEILGEDANGTFADLTIVDIPAGIKYRIKEYDGYESIEYADKINWSVATEMQKLIVMRGLPGSGKTTLAKEMCSENKTLIRVNRDDLRAEHPDWIRHKFNKKVEKEVAAERDRLISALLEQGFSVVSDDTNLTDKHINHFKQLAEKYKVEFEIVDLRDVDIDVCIERDKQRQYPVSKDVILKMHYENIVKSTAHFTQGNAIICDIDGTLAHMTNRGPFDEDKYQTDIIDFPLVHILDLLQEKYFIYLVSGRQGTDTGRSNTEAWLQTYSVPYDALLMREAGDKRKDSIVKKEIYENHIRPNHKVEFVFDDRPQVVRAWRSLNLKVFDCGMGYEF